MYPVRHIHEAEILALNLVRFGDAIVFGRWLLFRPQRGVKTGRALMLPFASPAGRVVGGIGQTSRVPGPILFHTSGHRKSSPPGYCT